MSRKVLLPVVLIVGVGLAAGDSYASPSVTTRVSVDSGGNEGNGGSWGPAISADGRYVAFWSVASNLVVGDSNGVADVFVHDCQTGATTRVSVDSAGNEANGTSEWPAISSDGRYVSFYSYASNLVPGDTNGTGDIFVHDRQTGETTRVSVDSAGNQANDRSHDPAISADGRYVAFESKASNLVPEDTWFWDIFVHDRQTGQTTQASVDSAGNPATGDSFSPAISADGRYVAFYSFDSDLVAGDSNGETDVFLHDRQTGETTRVSVDSSGAQANSWSEWPTISADGRYVAFSSNASNLVPGGTRGQEVFVHDCQTGQTTLVSVDSAGNEGTAFSYDPSTSADGRYVAFAALASNLVPGDTNGETDVFVHDRQTGETGRASVDVVGNEGKGRSSSAAISADGRYVAFSSQASNLVPGDTNGTEDVFVHDRDSDGDGVVVGFDNCLFTPNPDQLDTDNDRLGNACDACPGDADCDLDGCADGEELPGPGALAPKPGSTGAYDPLVWYDFFDVPVPANPDPAANGARDRAVAMDDVLAVLFYFGTFDGDAGDPPNANGVRYDTIKDSCDWDADTVPDKEGLCYDRSPGPDPNPPWDAGAPSGAVSMDDVLAVLAQVGLSCVDAP